MLTLVIGNKNYSSWSLRPWYLLKKFDIEFEEIRLVFDTPGFYSELKKYSLAGKVPVITDDGQSVWESLAICEYLAEKFSDKNMWPVDNTKRAHARSVSCEMISDFGALRNAMPMNCRASGRKVEIDKAVQKDIDRICTMWRECRDANAESGPWLFGKFSIADAMYAPVASRFRTYGLPLEHTQHDYIDTVLNDPVYQEWLADSKAEVEVVEHEEVG
ncbi:MAG: glutathione S-transferase family protein [Gammaproteobacteria bacterium]|nr:glutathione S-transferase family protein [Gammaproteobacteria bacterium]